MPTYLANVDLAKNELRNARVQNLGSAPSSPVAGQLYYNSGDNKLYWWNGTIWVDATGGAVAYGTPGSSAVGDSAAAGGATSVSRSDHVHGREAFGAVTTVTAGDSAANGSATTVAHSDHNHGLPWDPVYHRTVRVATTVAGTLATSFENGDAIDGVTLATGDRILIKNQSTGSENGIYTVNAAGAPTRAVDMDAAAEVQTGALVPVSEGTSQADSAWMLSTDGAVILGSTSLTFTLVAAKPGAPTASAVGDTGTQGGAASISRSDHRHAREAFGTPGSSAVGDSAAAGSATTVAHSDHVHGREAFGAVTGETSFGSSSANGSATTLARSDHAHGNPTHGAAAHSAISISDLAAPTGTVSWNSQKISNLLDPTAAQDAATKAYVDAARSGLDVKASVRVATTTNGTLATAFENGDTVDGVVLATGDRILIKDQAAGAENGLYTVNASGAPTRATDADSSTEVTGGLFVFVEEGTTNADSGWVLSNDGAITLGTTALSFVQFSGAGQIVAGAGLTKTGNTLDVGGTSNRITVAADSVDISTSYVGQASITTLGTVTTGTWNGTDVAVADGGTGASTAAGAKTNLGFMTRFAVDVGDGSSTAITVTHNLGTRDVTVGLYQAASPYAEVVADVEHTTVNTVTLTFAVAPTSSQYRAVVVG